MVQKTINKLPKSMVDVQVTVPWSDLQPKWNETLQKLASELEIPGFRKGQAPLEMAEQRLGQQVHQELIKNTMPQALIEALQGTDVVPIDYPQYNVVSFSKGNDLVFKATITERPVVKIGEYKSIKVSKPQIKSIGEEDINKVIDDLFKRWKARQPIKPTNPTPQTLPAQSPTTPGGGSLSFNKPQDSQSSQLPIISADEPSDEFAKAVGATSLEDLKNKIKQDLEADAKYNNELDYEEAILQEVEKMTQVEVPDILVQDELNRMLVSLQRQVSNMGMLFEDYVKSQNETLESLKNKWRVQAEKNVRMELGLAEIARAEGITISDQELQDEINKIQDPRTRSQFDMQEPRMHLRHALRQTKTLNLLKTIVPSA